MSMLLHYSCSCVKVPETTRILHDLSYCVDKKFGSKIFDKSTNFEPSVKTSRQFSIYKQGAHKSNYCKSIYCYKYTMTSQRSHVNTN